MPAHIEHLNAKGDGGAGSGFEAKEVQRRLSKFAGPRTKVQAPYHLARSHVRMFGWHAAPREAPAEEPRGMRHQTVHDPLSTMHMVLANP